MRRLLLALVLALNCGSASNAAQPLDQLHWLVEAPHGWQADASKLGGLSTITTRYETVADGSLIRFTTEFADAKGNVVNRYAGNIYADPGSGHLKVWYVSSKNEITQGDLTSDGRNLVFALAPATSTTGTPQYRVEMVPDDGYHSYVWTLFNRDGDSWKRLFSLTYSSATS